MRCILYRSKRVGAMSVTKWSFDICHFHLYFLLVKEVNVRLTAKPYHIINMIILIFDCLKYIVNTLLYYNLLNDSENVLSYPSNGCKYFIGSHKFFSFFMFSNILTNHNISVGLILDNTI